MVLRRGRRRHLQAIAVLLALPSLMITCSTAWGQGIDNGSGGDISDVSGGPRRIAVPLSGSAEPGAEEQFGGVTGGRSRQAGGPGSPARSVMSSTTGNPDEDRLGPPLGGSGTSILGETPGLQGRPLGGRLGPSGVRVPIEDFQPPQSPTPPTQTEILRGRRQDYDPTTLTRHPKLDLPPGPRTRDRPTA